MGGYLSLAMELAPEVLSLVGTAVKRLRVEELTLHYTIAGRWDAAGAAVQYGSVYATGGVLYPLLEQGLDVRRCSVGAEIDFQEENPRVYVCLNLSYQVWEALLLGIKSRQVGAACLDVYEEEADVFFEDFSGHIIDDDVLARLISMPNVIVTSHQAFLTEEALSNIAETTVSNLIKINNTGKCENELCWRGTSAEDCKSGKCF
jgi:hypothetical protein